MHSLPLPATAFLAELSRRLGVLRTEPEIIDCTVEMAGGFLRAHRCYFVECLERENRIVVSRDWIRDEGASLTGSFSLFDFGGAEWWHQYSSGDFVVEDSDLDPLTAPMRENYRALRVRSYAVQPYKRDGAWTVVIAVTDEKPRQWTSEDLAVLEDVVARVWPLVERARADAAVARLTLQSERMRRLYETVVGNTPDLVYVFDLDHRFTFANPALLKMWGRAAGESIGLNCLELGYPQWHAEMHDREIDEVIAHRRPIRGEVALNGIEGRRMYDYIFVPVIGADGSVEAIAGTTRDVTDLRHQTEALREADRKKDQFIALLAHELRNPLAPLRTGLEIMRLASGDTARLDKTRIVMERQLSHMVRLVDDLLDVSRITNNKMELRRTGITLSDVLSNAVDTARPAIDAAGHDLRISLPPEPVTLHADLTRLAQVIANLLTNSARYTPEGGLVEVVARVDGPEVVIEVRDNGIGIPPESLGNLFQMFSQVDRRPDNMAGGLGIGLALVKGLTEMHGGRVAVASEGEGRGSTFSVRIPTAKAASGDPRPAPATPSPAARFAHRRVLVVDDNRDAAGSLGMMLEILGCEVRMAHDGLEAVEEAARFEPELVLMDLGMPRLDGYDAVRRIRQQPWGRKAKIVALTGWGQEAERVKSREAGCDGHLVKPAGAAELQELVGRLTSFAGEQVDSAQAVTDGSG